MNYVIWPLALVLLLLCGGCAREEVGQALSPRSEVGGALLGQADGVDLLLDDDEFFDDESPAGEEDSDPLEALNRVFFELNDVLYYWVLSPLNTSYSAVVPLDIRSAIGNFVNNFAAPVRLINSLLQGNLVDAGAIFSRFVINSSLGVYGFGDPGAREFGISPREADFGQTLGSWGVGQGFYLCLPLFGPSTLRDSLGFMADSSAHPMVFFVNDLWLSAGYYTGTRVNLLSLHPNVYEDLKKYSLDPYVSMRQLYLDYRKKSE